MNSEAQYLIRQLLAKLQSKSNPLVGPCVELSTVLDSILASADIEQVTADQYKRGLKFFSLFLGRPATSNDLTHERVNDWISWLQSVRKLDPVTIKGHRAGVCRVWNHLAIDGLVAPYISRKLRSPKIKRKLVESWSREQVCLLLEAVDNTNGRLRNGIKIRDYFRALILVAYDSGLRPVDLRGLRWQDIDFTKGSGTIVQHKTGNPHCFSLSDEAQQAIRLILEPVRQIVFCLGKSGTAKQLKAITEAASIHKSGQGLAMLRKAHATEIYRERGLSAAAESLGHVSGSAIAKRFYVDSSAQHRAQLPPRLSK